MKNGASRTIKIQIAFNIHPICRMFAHEIAHKELHKNGNFLLPKQNSHSPSFSHAKVKYISFVLKGLRMSASC
jgi:hypothetical protein